MADERLAGTEEFPGLQEVWTRNGIVAAELLLRKESNTLFDDMVKKLSDYPKLRQMLQNILFCGNEYPFERDNYLINLGVTFGFLKDNHGMVGVGNRIFETKLYDLFLSEMIMDHAMVSAEPIERNRYVMDGYYCGLSGEAIYN